MGWCGFTDTLSCDWEVANAIRALAASRLVATFITEDCVDVKAAGRLVPQGDRTPVCPSPNTTTTTITCLHPRTEQSSDDQHPPTPQQLASSISCLHSAQTSVPAPLLRSCLVHSSSLSICVEKAPPMTGLRDNDDDHARCVKLIEIFFVLSSCQGWHQSERVLKPQTQMTQEASSSSTSLLVTFPDKSAVHIMIHIDSGNAVHST